MVIRTPSERAKKRKKKYLEKTVESPRNTETLTLRLLEVGEDDWAEVILLIPVRVVVGGDARVREVLDVADVLDIGGIFALARDPYHLAHHLGRGLLLDVLAQVGRHLLGQLARVRVGLGLPSEDLVQLDDEARVAVLEAVIVVFGAASRKEVGGVDGADLAFASRTVESAVDDALGRLVLAHQRVVG